MKKECSIIRDMLPLYFENMVSEDTAEFVKKHIENCPDCAAELKAMKSGKEISKTEPSKRESDAKVITAVKKKIAKKIVKTVAVVCLAFAGLLSAVLLYTGIGHPVTRDNISLSTKTESGYNYIILETEAGKSLFFDSKTEDIVNDKNEICGQKITLYNLQYHNNFSQKNNLISWGSPTNTKAKYMELVVELGNDTLRISNAELRQSPVNSKPSRASQRQVNGLRPPLTAPSVLAGG